MTLHLEPDVGDRPVRCYEMALGVAQKLGIPVEFKFNDFKCRVHRSGSCLVLNMSDLDRKYAIDFEKDCLKEVSDEEWHNARWQEKAAAFLSGDR